MADDQNLSFQDLQDLQHIRKALPEGHPMSGKLDKVISATPPNTGLAAPAKPPDIPEAPGFFESMGNSIGKTIKGNIESWKHGGALTGQDTGRDLPVTTGEGFNPFSPVDTAGYLIPQPIKNIGHSLSQGNWKGAAGETIGEALPYATAPIGAVSGETALKTSAAPVRAAAKTANTVIRHAPEIGGAAGIVGGLADVATGGHWSAPLWMPIVGERTGKFVQRLGEKYGPVPGENLGLQKQFAGGAMEPAAGPERGTPIEPSPIPPPIPREAYEARGPIQGPQLGEPPIGPQRGTPKGAPKGVGPSPEELNAPPTPVRRPIPAPVERTSPKPVEAPETAQGGRLSVPEQIELAKSLGYRNLGEAMKQQPNWEQMISTGRGATAERALTPQPPAIPPPMAQAPSPPPVEPVVQASQQVMEQQIQPPSTAPESANIVGNPRRFHEAQQDNAMMNEMEQENERAQALELGRDTASRYSVGTTKSSRTANMRGHAIPQEYIDQWGNRPMPGASIEANRLVGNPRLAMEDAVDYITGKPNKK